MKIVAPHRQMGRFSSSLQVKLAVLMNAMSYIIVDSLVYTSLLLLVCVLLLCVYIIGSE